MTTLSLDLSKKLPPMETELVWWQNKYSKRLVVLYENQTHLKMSTLGKGWERICPAPTFEELWAVLPKQHNFAKTAADDYGDAWLYVYGQKNLSCAVYYVFHKRIDTMAKEIAETPTEALGKMYLYLIEGKLL